MQVKIQSIVTSTSKTEFDLPKELQTQTLNLYFLFFEIKYNEVCIFKGL